MIEDYRKNEVLSDMAEEIIKKDKEIERLNNIIKNAIEFINGGEGWKKLNLTHQEKMLLSILKDSDKE